MYFMPCNDMPSCGTLRRFDLRICGVPKVCRLPIFLAESERRGDEQAQACKLLLPAFAVSS